MHPFVTYTPCATSSREKNGNIIKFTQFEEENLLSETRNDAEIGDESNDDSIIPPLLSEEEKFDDDHISMETLHDIRDGNQTHPTVYKREARRKRCNVSILI